MRLSGRIIKDTKTVKEAVIEKGDENSSFRDILESCLIDLCRELDIQVPVWMKKNTREFASYHKTSFTKDQFIEKVKFDRFIIEVHL